jgi:hypothetical protein
MHAEKAATGPVETTGNYGNYSNHEKQSDDN